MEKLRQILDNPYDPKIKKSISKDNENLESIRQRLSGEPSKADMKHALDDILSKKYSSLKPRVAVHTKKEKIVQPKTKQFEATEQASDVKDKPFEEDLYEVEKVDVSEPEFLEAKPKEVAKETSPEKSISEEPSLIDKKDKMVVFQEIKIIDKIQMYRPIIIFEMWAFTLTLGVVAVSGLFLMRDWLFLNFGVYGDKFIPTPEGTQNIHIWFGFAFAVLGLFHLAIHIFSKKKEILPKQTLRDFKAFLHSGMYLIGLARREDYGTSERFNGRQRIIYLALVYILGLTILTGLLHYMNFLSHDLAMIHVIPAGLSIMVLLFHFLITIRKHDSIALKGAFITGKLPRWYVRKNHPIWYETFGIERKTTSGRLSHPITVQTDKTLIGGGSDLTNAASKSALFLNDCPDNEGKQETEEELQ